MADTINFCQNIIVGFRKRLAQPFSKVVLAIFLLVGIVGVFSPYSYNILHAGPVIEVAFILLSFSLVFPLNRMMICFYIFSILYVVITFAEAFFLSNANFADYLQAYKAFFYVALLSPFVKSNIFSAKEIKALFFAVLAIFLAKYTYSRLLHLSPLVGSRPGVYVENNFELVFLLLLFYLVLEDLKNKFSFCILVLFIIALSASRSSYLCLVAILFFSLPKMNQVGCIKKITLIVLLGVVGWLISVDRAEVIPSGVNIISKPNTELSSNINMGEPTTAEPTTDEPTTAEPTTAEPTTAEPTTAEPTTAEPTTAEPTTAELSFNESKYYGAIDGLLRKLQGIDRVRFLMLFLDETHDWKWYDYFLGTKALTPLSSETCSALAYWDDLHSYAGDGKCYSVILHSYILRVIYDHGVLGLIFLIVFTAVALRKNHYTWMTIACVLSVVLASSLSVSAFNSIFYVFSVMLYLGKNNCIPKCN